MTKRSAEQESPDFSRVECQGLNLRVDVDYAYPSRLKSFFLMALGVKRHCRGYLAYAKFIARLVNRSPLGVRVYWFFTVHTLPDGELLGLLTNGRHVVGLHVVNDAVAESAVLQRLVKAPVKFFSIHGTDNLFAQLLWGRRVGQTQAVIPTGFGLVSIHGVPGESLDMGYTNTQVLLALHPDWLFKRSRRGCGPTVHSLTSLLKVEEVSFV